MLLLAAAFGEVFASPVTTDEALTAVGNWLSRKPQLGCRLGSSVAGARTCTTTNGAAFHVVKLAGGGFIVTSADTEQEPIVAFSSSDDLIESEKNPLWLMLCRDFSAQVGCARQAQYATAGSTGVAVDRPAQKWAKLLPVKSTNGVARVTQAATGLASISDVRVAPLLETKWNQEKDSGYVNKGDPCYNYYTPENYPCGCVATAAAQIMRYHKYPTASVEPGTYVCQIETGKDWIDSTHYYPVCENLTLTMQGGFYDWENMPLVPANGTTLTQRKAIGKLTSDVGIACRMSYGENGSSTGGYMVARCLPERFGYADAITVCDEHLIPITTVNCVLRSNLDAKLPVIAGLSDGTYGHAVVADGYGYSMSTFYVHFNFGWSGDDDAWYAPPSVSEYTLFETLVFNIYPKGVENGVICSGRVVDGDGLPLAEAEVCAKGATVSTVFSDANGIYSFILEPGSYTITSGNASRSVMLYENVGTQVNDNGTYTVSPYVVNNLCDVNLTVTGDAPEVIMRTVTFNANGVEVGVATRSVEDGTAVGELPTATRDGYDFLGWFTAANGGTQITSSTVVTADVTYYAQWEEEEPVLDATWYTSKSEAKTAALESGKRIVMVYGRYTCGNTMAAVESLTSDSSVRAIVDTNFVLWFCDCDNTPWSEVGGYVSGLGSFILPCIAVIDPSKMSTYVARSTGYQSASSIAAFLQANVPVADTTKYTVSFNGNGGSVTEVSRSVEDGTAVGELPTATRDGYDFLGWFTAANGGTQVTSSTVVTADVTWYAHWQEVESKMFTITFDANGGSFGIATRSVEDGAAVGELLTATRDGYDFLGWFTAANGGTQVTPSTVVTSDVTWYAHWQEKTVVIDVPSIDSDDDDEQMDMSIANTYDGVIVDDGRLPMGYISVKAAKATGKGDARVSKVTATIQMTDEAKKVTVKASVSVSKTTMRQSTSDGRVLELTLSRNGISGTFDGYEIEGVRNLLASTAKSDNGSEAKRAAEAVYSQLAGNYVMSYGDEEGWNVVTISIMTKGKVKVSGKLANGTSFATTSQLIVGDDNSCIPVIYTKGETSLAFSIYFTNDGGEISVFGCDDAAVSKVGTLEYGLSFSVADSIVDWFDEYTVCEEFLPYGVSVEPNGKKWIVADGAKAGSIKVVDGEVVDKKESENPSGLKLTYNAKTGTFSGSFKVYALDAKNKLKSFSATVNGVVVNGVGYGTATIKKRGHCAVAIE